MVDFKKIEDIEVEYEYKGYDEVHHYSQIPGNEGRTVSPDKNNIRFSIKDDDAALDDRIYQIIINKEEGEIYVKGDFLSLPMNGMRRIQLFPMVSLKLFQKMMLKK